MHHLNRVCAGIRRELRCSPHGDRQREWLAAYGSAERHGYRRSSARCGTYPTVVQLWQHPDWQFKLFPDCNALQHRKRGTLDNKHCFGGANAGDFAETNTCGSSVAAGASCTISVTFTPLSTTSFAASLTVTDNAAGSPRSVSLSGTGTVPPAPGASIAPAGPLSFAATTSATSQSQTVTLTNSGNAALSVTSITIGGANATDFAQTNTCGSSVAAGDNCTISVTFTPLSAASVTASLSVADNAGNSPQTVTLNGIGSAPTTFTLASETAAGNASQTTAATFTIDVTPQNGSINSPINFSASGLPQGYTATFSPSTVTPGSKATTVTMTIGNSNIAANRSSAWPIAAPALALIGFCFLTRKQRRRMLTLCVLALVSIGAIGSLSGCGGGFALARQPQTYTITITASGANQAQTTTVQLTVE